MKRIVIEHEKGILFSWNIDKLFYNPGMVRQVLKCWVTDDLEIAKWLGRSWANSWLLNLPNNCEKQNHQQQHQNYHIRTIWGGGDGGGAAPSLIPIFVHYDPLIYPRAGCSHSLRCGCWGAFICSISCATEVHVSKLYISCNVYCDDEQTMEFGEELSAKTCSDAYVHHVLFCVQSNVQWPSVRSRQKKDQKEYFF